MCTSFKTDKALSAEDFFQLGTAEVGDRKHLVDLKAGLMKDSFDVFWVVVIKTVLVDIFEVDWFETKWVNVGFFEPVAENLGQSALVGNFDDGGAAGLENAVKFVGDFLHVFEMVGGAYHEESVESVVFEGDVVDVARFGGDFVAVVAADAPAYRELEYTCRQGYCREHQDFRSHFGRLVEDEADGVAHYYNQG